MTSGAIMTLTGAATRPALAMPSLLSQASFELSQNIAIRVAGGRSRASSAFATWLIKASACA